MRVTTPPKRIRVDLRDSSERTDQKKAMWLKENDFILVHGTSEHCSKLEHKSQKEFLMGNFVIQNQWENQE
jgi:hypothetical protein